APQSLRGPDRSDREPARQPRTEARGERQGRGQGRRASQSHGIVGSGARLMLETLDLSRSLERSVYVREVARRQIQLRELGYQIHVQKRPVVILFEGWDAAGKGGAIKRLTGKLDPRGYTVHPISAPHGEDKSHHYLYRFWRRLPEPGHMAIF